MTDTILPALDALSDELIPTTGDIGDFVAAHENLHALRGTMARTLRSIHKLKSLLATVRSPEWASLYDQYLSIDQESPGEVDGDQELVDWGRDLDDVLDRIHSIRRILDNTYEQCVRSSLSRLGQELGRAQRALGLPLATAMALAYKHGSDYRRTLLDGRKLVIEDAGNQLPDFLTGFVSGHMDKDIPSKMDVERYRKTLSKALSAVSGVVTDYLYGAEMVDLHEGLAPVAEKLEVTVLDLIPVVEFEIKQSHASEEHTWLFDFGQFKNIARKEAAA